MPPGNTRTKAPAKVVERSTAEACISIAKRVQQARRLSGDEAGSEAAAKVAEAICQELLQPIRKGA